MRRPEGDSRCTSGTSVQLNSADEQKDWQSHGKNKCTIPMTVLDLVAVLDCVAMAGAMSLVRLRLLRSANGIGMSIDFGFCMLDRAWSLC